MKKPLLMAGLLLGNALFANQIVVFAKGESITLDTGGTISVPKEATKAEFLARCLADASHPARFASPIKVIAPPEWGKKLNGATGVLNFHDSFHGGFFVRVALTGLAPEHPYILTLNGKPGLAGNERLVDPVPGLEKERYFDFMKITTDRHGRYEATFGIALLPGPYDVRFYVKDTDDFKIVLYHDYFKFAVE